MQEQKRPSDRNGKEKEQKRPSDDIGSNSPSTLASASSDDEREMVHDTCRVNGHGYLNAEEMLPEVTPIAITEAHSTESTLDISPRLKHDLITASPTKSSPSIFINGATKADALAVGKDENHERIVNGAVANPTTEGITAAEDSVPEASTEANASSQLDSVQQSGKEETSGGDLATMDLISFAEIPVERTVHSPAVISYTHDLNSLVLSNHATGPPFDPVLSMPQADTHNSDGHVSEILQSSANFDEHELPGGKQETNDVDDNAFQQVEDDTMVDLTDLGSLLVPQISAEPTFGVAEGVADEPTSSSILDSTGDVAHSDTVEAIGWRHFRPGRSAPSWVPDEMAPLCMACGE